MAILVSAGDTQGQVTQIHILRHQDLHCSLSHAGTSTFRNLHPSDFCPLTSQPRRKDTLPVIRSALDCCNGVLPRHQPCNAVETLRKYSTARPSNMCITQVVIYPCGRDERLDRRNRHRGPARTARCPEFMSVGTVSTSTRGLTITR